MFEFEFGQTVRITTEVRVDNVLTDPTTLTCKTESPTGTKTTYTYGVDSQLTRLSTGLYRLRVAVSVAGIWKYRWDSTGAAGVDEGVFLVTPALVT